MESRAIGLADGLPAVDLFSNQNSYPPNRRIETSYSWKILSMSVPRQRQPGRRLAGESQSTLAIRTPVQGACFLLLRPLQLESIAGPK